MARISEYQRDRTYSIAVRDPLIAGGALRNDESNSAYEWERTIAQDGSIDGSFKLLGSEQVGDEELRNNGFTTGELTRLYRELLGCDVQEAAGGDLTYRGIIWRLTLSTGRRMKTRSLDDMCNEVMVRYATANTVWLPLPSVVSTNDDVDALVRISRRRFGRKQCVINNDTITGVADARRFARRHLRTRAYPRDQRAFQKDRPLLQVETIGYQYLLHWLSGSLLAGVRVDQAIRQLIDDFNTLYGYELFRPGQIDNNGVFLSSAIDGTFREMLDTVTRLDADDEQLWQWWVDERLRIHFQPIPFRPHYIENENDGENGLFTTGGQWVHSRRIEPRRVVRDETYPVFENLPGSPFESQADALIESITVYSDDTFSMTSLDLTQTELWGVSI